MDKNEPPVALAADIGGTKMDVAMVDISGRLVLPLAQHPVPFTADGIAAAQGLLDILQPYIDKAQAYGARLRGIGLGVCGVVDVETGEIILSPNLHWRNLPFGAMARERFRLPVCAAVDVRQAALGEWMWGSAHGAKNFAWVTIGTGYGGYFILNGRFYPGTHGSAGNFGHIAVDEVNGYPCGCGRRGCAETYVAGPAIARQGQRAADEGRSPLLHRLAGEGPVTAPLVFQAEAAGDEAARQVVAGVVRHLAISLSGLVNTRDLELMVLGGGVMKAGPLFLARLDAAVREHLMTVEARRDLRIVRESLPNPAVAGAAAHVFLACGDLRLPSPA
ncbi:MAG: ROK family protein [Anaerolineae bacterium]|nr:ROK family protein [Anaerolineae bacterium]